MGVDAEFHFRTHEPLTAKQIIDLESEILMACPDIPYTGDFEKDGGADWHFVRLVDPSWPSRSANGRTHDYEIYSLMRYYDEYYPRGNPEAIAGMMRFLLEHPLVELCWYFSDSYNGRPDKPFTHDDLAMFEPKEQTNDK